MAGSLIILAVFISSCRSFVVGYLITRGNPNISLMAVQNIVAFLIAVPMCVVVAVEILNGFEFKYTDFLIGGLSGVMSMIAGVTSIYVVVKGKAGSADAIIQTYSIFLMMIDMIFELRTPTYLQGTSITLAFLSTLTIFYGNRKKKEESES